MATSRTARLTTAALGAVLVALPGGVVGAAAAVAAQGAAVTRPAAPAARGDVTKRIDVDGDGRADTVTLRAVLRGGARAGYDLSVRTATGRTDRLRLPVDDLGIDRPASDFWVGVTGIDGVRGNEVVLDLVGGIGDATDVRSYAWRDGRIVLVPAAGSTARWPNWQIGIVEFGHVVGYTFGVGPRGVRQVTKHDLTASRSGRTFTGTNTLYRWSRDGWRRQSARPVSLPRKAASALSGLHGLTWR